MWEVVVIALEIERKFLLGEYPADRIAKGEIEVVSRLQLEQTYLAYSQNEEIRIRKLVDGEQVFYTHTFKKGHGTAREEMEYEIDEEIYHQLINSLGKQPLRKQRTRFSYEGWAVDVDEYEQFDLKTVEVEFESLEQARMFQPPDWFGREIGGEEEYRNKILWIKSNGQHHGRD